MNFLKKKIVYIPLLVIFILVLIGTLPKLAGLIMALGAAGGSIYLYRKSNKFNQFNKGLKALITTGLVFAFILGIGFINYDPQVTEHKKLVAEKSKIEEELNEKSKKEEEERIAKEETNKKLEEEKKQLEEDRIAKEESDKKLEEEKKQLEEEQLKKEEQTKKDIEEKAIAEAEEQKKIEQGKKKAETESAKVVAKQNNTSNNESKKTTNSSVSNSSTGKDVTTNDPAKSGEIVYWVSGGKSYHSRQNCRSLAQSKNILSGPASKCPKTDPCNNCIR